MPNLKINRFLTASILMIALMVSGCTSMTYFVVVRDRVVRELGFSPPNSLESAPSYSVGTILVDADPAKPERPAQAILQPLCNSRDILKAPVDSVAVNPSATDLDNVAKTIPPIPPEISRLLNPEWRISKGTFGGLQSSGLPEAGIRRMIQGAAKGCLVAISESLNSGRKVSIVSALLSIGSDFDVEIKGSGSFDLDRLKRSLRSDAESFSDPFLGPRSFVDASLIEFSPAAQTEFARYRLVIHTAIGYRLREITKEDL